MAFLTFKWQVSGGSGPHMTPGEPFRRPGPCHQEQESVPPGRTRSHRETLASPSVSAGQEDRIRQGQKSDHDILYTMSIGLISRIVHCSI